MSNSFPAKTSQTLTKHTDNMMASLAHRLEVARVTNNHQLIELLEQEQQQVAPPATQPYAFHSPVEWFKTFRQGLSKTLFGSSQLQVKQIVDNAGELWWYASDPQTGECVYADSELELRLWIKKNYPGK